MLAYTCTNLFGGCYTFNCPLPNGQIQQIRLIPGFTNITPIEKELLERDTTFRVLRKSGKLLLSDHIVPSREIEGIPVIKTKISDNLFPSVDSDVAKNSTTDQDSRKKAMLGLLEKAKEEEKEAQKNENK